MAKRRKTIEIAFLLEKANHFLLHSGDKLADIRYGTANLLELALHETGNYRGFRYLDANDMKESESGKSVGIIRDASGGTDHKFPDQSRVQYHG